MQEQRNSVLLERAYLLLRAGEVDAAASAFRDVLEEDGGLYEAHLELGRIFFYREQFAPAIRELLNCLKHPRAEDEAKILLGKLYFYSGEQEQGMRVFSEIQGNVEAESFLRSRGMRNISPVPEITAGKTKKEPSLKKEVKTETEGEMWKKAKDYLESGRIERAFFYLSKLSRIRKDPGLPWEEILFLTGYHGMKLGHTADAGKALEILVRKSKNIEAFKLLARIYGRQGDYKKAVSVLEAALEIEPDSVENRGNLAIYYKRLEMPLKAIDSLVRILELEPDNEVACYNLALIYYENGQFVEAMNLVRKIKKLIPPKNMTYTNTQILERKLEKCLKN